MKMKLLAVLLSAVCAGLQAAEVAGAGVPAAASAASGVDPAADTAKLQEAAALIRAHQPQAAIDRVLDPLIAAQEAENANRKEAVYCANSPAESLYYMVRAAVDHQSAIALPGTWCTALYLRGYAQTDLGKLQAAEADYTRAVALSPSNPQYLSEMGQLQLLKREWNAALSWFHRAEAAYRFAGPEQADAELGHALRGIGYADVELGKLDEAEAAYRRCLQIDANDEKAKAELGYVRDLKAKQAGK